MEKHEKMSNELQIHT